MVKNGAFHERPDDYDIYVDDAMIPVVGARQINWHIATSWHDDNWNIMARVDYHGHCYLAERHDQGADWYYEIVAEMTPVGFVDALNEESRWIAHSLYAKEMKIITVSSEGEQKVWFFDDPNVIQAVYVLFSEHVWKE